MGKPIGADIKLGLATAPVIFALERDPSLNALLGKVISDKEVLRVFLNNHQ